MSLRFTKFAKSVRNCSCLMGFVGFQALSCCNQLSFAVILHVLIISLTFSNVCTHPTY